MAHALGIARLDVYLQFDRPLDDGELGAIRELLRRRGRGEPVAHLTGRREFYGRSFRVSPDVLIPRPETESLVERALVAARERSGALRIADLGTGSGCVAISLACELPSATVIAVDLSAAALAVAAENAEALGVADRVLFVEGGWVDGLVAELDLVVSNPPYVTTAELDELPRDVGFEPRLALDGGPDGLEAYRLLLPAVAEFSRRVRWVGLEVDSRRAAAVDRDRRACSGPMPRSASRPTWPAVPGWSRCGWGHRDDDRGCDRGDPRRRGGGRPHRHRLRAGG